jgi:site-specific DNA-methyltransferase (adenine-specific)
MNGPRRDLDETVKCVIFLRYQKESAKWDKKHTKIAEAGKRKQSDAAKAQPRDKTGKMKSKPVAAHIEQRPASGGRAVAREARAAEAKASTGTMGRAEQIFKHADLSKKVASLEMKPAEALREIRSRKRRLELEEAAAKAVEHETCRPEWSILNVDVIDGLASVRDEHGPARLIFTDPPYNIGIDYGTGKDADSLSDSDYLRWVDEWIGLCCDCLTEDGSLWVMIGDEYAAEYAMILKDEKSFVFNPEPVTRPSDRQTKYSDSRAASGGKLWDDVWQIPRLTGTCAERIPDFPTQLPLALVEPIVLCASMPGDLVVDPFNGSGTTGVASVRNGRKYVGIEKSEKFADIAHTRLMGTKVN